MPARSILKIWRDFSFGAKVLFLVFVAIVVDAAVVLGTRGAGPKIEAAPEASTEAIAPPNRAASDPARKNYLGACGSYLVTANKQGTELARTMAGAIDGSSTLSDIKRALSSARFVENAGYQGDYRERVRGVIPPGLEELAANIEETHRLFRDATGEYLEYWKDQNVEHISSGSATLMKSIEMMNSSIADTTDEMKRLEPETPR